MKKTLTISAIALTLAGCKVDMSTDVMLSTLNEPTKEIISNVAVEVASCTSYEDSRKESDSLIRIKEKLPTIFNGAKFVECYKKKMDSFAIFTVPVFIGKDEPAGDYNLWVHGTERVPLIISASKKFRESLHNFKKREISKLNINSFLNVKNDTNNVLKFRMTSAYLGDIPVSNISYIHTFKPNDLYSIKLSNVATDALLRKDSAGQLGVFFAKDTYYDPTETQK
ncbi:DUF7424 family protein [Pasteurella multocida]|uniref:DUF7424 family protein n=1 Tax=Pasteurella multocida TaxID=747 RepID=UPI001F53B94A|nr:hypothetical protein [Pasteurella multocida]